MVNRSLKEESSSSPGALSLGNAICAKFREELQQKMGATNSGEFPLQMTPGGQVNYNLLGKGNLVQSRYSKPGSCLSSTGIRLELLTYKGDLCFLENVNCDKNVNEKELKTYRPQGSSAPLETFLS